MLRLMVTFSRVGKIWKVCIKFEDGFRDVIRRRSLGAFVGASAYRLSWLWASLRQWVVQSASIWWVLWTYGGLVWYEFRGIRVGPVSLNWRPTLCMIFQVLELLILYRQAIDKSGTPCAKPGPWVLGGDWWPCCDLELVLLQVPQLRPWNLQVLSACLW